MVNDAKATNSGIIDRQNYNSSYQLENGVKGPRGEFLPLRVLDETQDLSNDDEYTGTSKYQR